MPRCTSTSVSQANRGRPNPMPERFHITIPDGDGGMALRVSRTFAGLPLTFTLVSASKDRGTHWSRHCDEHVVVNPEDDEALLATLMALEKRDCPNVLLPIMTPAFKFVVENRKVLSQHFQIPAISSMESLTTASDKWKLHDFCRQHDLPVLKSFSLSESARTQREGGPADLTFPVLVKTRDGQGGEGFTRIETLDALDNLRHQLGEREAERRFVQPWVNGYDVSLAVYCEGGEIKCHTLWRAVAYGPNAYATPQCIRFIEDDAVIETGRRLLRLLEWEGICDIDFFVDWKTGQAWILEVNARFFGTAPACVQAGVNFTPIMCERALSREEREWPIQKPEVYCETKGLTKALKIPDVRSKLLRRPIKRLSVGMFLRDPGPDLYQRLVALKVLISVYLRGLRKRPDEKGTRRRANSWLHLTGMMFLGAQLVSILCAPFIPVKFFCWAPYDQHTRYSIEVIVDGRFLSSDEVSKRYRYPQTAWEVREMQNVISIVSQYERTYGAKDSAQVSVTYRTNGHEQRTWTWPQT
jgi:predicted ATP-grasp superfamily ATP-dependent carboligase